MSEVPYVNLIIKTSRGEVLESFRTTFVPAVGDSVDGRPVTKRHWETGVMYTGFNTGSTALSTVTITVK